MLRYLTIDLIEDLYGSEVFRNKVVFLRVDTNTTVAHGDIQANARIIRSARTIRRLALEKGARVIVGTHNGRPGDLSYIGTGFIQRSLRPNITGDIDYIGNTFIDDTLNEDTIKAISRMKGGTALLLENLRFLPGESQSLPPSEHAKSRFIRDLIEKCGVEFFVLDAFSIAHRSHRSVVGFQDIPNIAGPNLHEELSTVDTLKTRFLKAENPSSIFMLGGTKIQDYFSLIERALREGLVRHILTGGLLANLCLVAKGYDLGSETRRLLERRDSKGKSLLDYLPKVEALLRGHEKTFVLPIDVAGTSNGSARSVHKVSEVPREFGAYDIGDGTVRLYENVIQREVEGLDADQQLMVYIKGPMGAYDLSIDFNTGSRKLLEFVISPQVKDRIYVVMGGGDTTAMLREFAIRETEIDYLSLAGGALIKMLGGEILPGIQNLEDSYERFGRALTGGGAVESGKGLVATNPSSTAALV